MNTAHRSLDVGRHQQVWRLAGPIILSNLSVPLLGAVDTAVMGHLPDPAYIGAVAVGAILFNFIYWGFGFLRMGTTGFAAQASGAEDSEELRASLARPVGLGALLGLSLIALQLPIEALAFTFMAPSAEVEGFARIYYSLRIWGAPATLITYALLGWLLGIGDARSVLILQLWLNGLNIVLNLFFVLGLGMTIDGVALATVISEYSALALGLAIAARALRAWPGSFEIDRILNRERLIALFRVNRDIFLRTLCLQIAFFTFTAQGAKLGDLQLAGNAILIQLQTFMAYGLDGFAHAAEVLVGKAVGRRRRESFREAVLTTTLWAAGTAGAFTLFYGLAGKLVVALFTDIEAVRAAAHEYLPWMIVSPIISVWSFQLDGIFIGATRTAAMRNAMLASLGIFLAAAWLLVPLLGNHGLWLALMLFMAGRALTLGAYYPALERSLEPEPA